MAGALAAAAPPPHVAQGALGVFEVSGGDLEAVHRVNVRAVEVARALRTVAGLPERFPSPVFVRIAEPEAGARTALITVEPAGVVSLALTLGPQLTPAALEQALVEAALVRQAVWLGRSGRGDRPAGWLVAMGVAASRVAAQPAWREWFGRESERRGPLPLAAALALEDGGEDSLAPAWLASRLLSSRLPRSAWRAAIETGLTGRDAYPAVLASWRAAVPGDPRLTWPVAWLAEARREGGPVRSAAASYRALTGAARFVFRAGGTDAVFTWERLWFWRSAPAVQSVLRRRVLLLPESARTGHPFFRDAHASLAEALTAVAAGDQAAYASSVARFEQELAAAIDLALSAERLVEGAGEAP